MILKNMPFCFSVFIALAMSLTANIFCSNSSEASFREKEPLIYPLNMSTADTLRKGEWYLTVPPWGWLAYGLNDRLTVAFDYPVALFIGTAAGAVKLRLAGTSTDSALTLEGYGWHIPYHYVDKRKDEFKVKHWGGQHWGRLNWSQRWSQSFRTHAYAGANYTDFEEYSPNLKDTFETKTFENQWTPNYGLGLEMRLSQWMYIHANYAKGNTFLYMDQIARKEIAVWGFGMAPFPSDWWGIFRSLRVEAAALWTKLDPIPYQTNLALPLYFTLYWQWGG